MDITPPNMEEFQQPFHIILNLTLSGLFTGYAEPNPADFPLFMYEGFYAMVTLGELRLSPMGLSWVSKPPSRRQTGYRAAPRDH